MGGRELPPRSIVEHAVRLRAAAQIQCSSQVLALCGSSRDCMGRNIATWLIMLSCSAFYSLEQKVHARVFWTFSNLTTIPVSLIMGDGQAAHERRTIE